MVARSKRDPLLAQVHAALQLLNGLDAKVYDQARERAQLGLFTLRHALGVSAPLPHDAVIQTQTLPHGSTIWTLHHEPSSIEASIHYTRKITRSTEADMHFQLMERWDRLVLQWARVQQPDTYCLDVFEGTQSPDNVLHEGQPLGLDPDLQALLAHGSSQLGRYCLEQIERWSNSWWKV